MRILPFIALAVFFAGPTPVFGTELRVLVSDNSGMPIYGVLDGEVQEGEIVLFSLEPKSYFSAAAGLGDEDGAAFDVPPGKYRIHVFSPGWREFESVIRITNEPRVVRIALDLAQIANFSVPPPEASLDGRVLGLRGQAAWVQLSPLYGPNRAWRTELQNIGVGAQGEFTLSHLQAGRYVLLVYGQETESSDPVVLASKIVDVGIKEVVEVQVSR